MVLLLSEFMLFLPATNDTTLNLTKTNTLEAEDIFSMMEEAGHISSKGSKSSGLQFRNETGTGKSSKSQFKFSEPQFRNETSKSSKSQFRLRNQTDTDTIISSGNRTSRGRESEPNFLFPAKAAKFLKAQNMFLNTTATNSSRSSRSNNDNADVTADSVVSANSGSTSAASCAWIGTAVTGLIHILYQIV